jgi:hypothetical protein
MSLRYNKIKNHPTTFHRLFGLSVDEFERIVKAVQPQWKKRVIQGVVCGKVQGTTLRVLPCVKTSENNMLPS